jgi:hypothetical protein
MMLLRSAIVRHNRLLLTLAISVACAARLAAQTPVQTPATASRPPGYAEVPAVHASDAQQLPEPFNPALHSSFRSPSTPRCTASSSSATPPPPITSTA